MPEPSPTDRLLRAADAHIDPARAGRVLGPVAHEQPFQGAGLVGPELAAWHAQGLAARMHPPPEGAWVGGGCSDLFTARQLDDALARARLQALFLPVSTVCVTPTEHIVATWYPDEHGRSAVYAAGPDGALHLRHDAIAGLLDGTPAGERVQPLPPLFDPEAMVARTAWVAGLLLHGTVDDDALASLPSRAVWERERAHLGLLPHLQAYWVVHHMLLGDPEALNEALSFADDRYPPVPGLRALAAAFTAGDEPRQLCDPGPLHDLRAALAEASFPHLAPAARDGVVARAALRETLRSTLSATLAPLRDEDDPSTQRALEAWDLLQRCAGHLAAAEPQLLDGWVSPGAARDALHHRLRTGESTPLEHPLRALAEGVGPEWLDIGAAAFRLGAPYDEDHPSARPGALVVWGTALGGFDPLLEAFHAEGFSAGRRRYLELAVVADRWYDGGAEAFLLTEMNDFARELGGWSHATTSFAFRALLARAHPEALRLADALLRRGPMNDATTPLLAALVDLAATHRLHDLAPALVALRRRGFGLGSPRRQRLEAVCAALDAG